jgi:3-methyladenine DNA glycosylase AlkD
LTIADWRLKEVVGRQLQQRPLNEPRLADTRRLFKSSIGSRQFFVEAKETLAQRNLESEVARSVDGILTRLRSLGDVRNREGMLRYAVANESALGVPTPTLRKLAREIGRDQALAEQLWRTEVFEARALAALIGEPAKVTEGLMERWTKDFDSWAICDGCCLSLFAETPLAHRKALEWTQREEEFVKRAGFSLMAVLAVHDKTAGDAKFLKFLPAIKRQSRDGRNFVKKAVNWALRQIGKRNPCLNAAAIETAEQIRKIDSPSARWIAADALRELKSEAVQRRLQKRPS